MTSTLTGRASEPQGQSAQGDSGLFAYLWDLGRRGLFNHRPRQATGTTPIHGTARELADSQLVILHVNEAAAGVNTVSHVASLLSAADCAYQGVAVCWDGCAVGISRADFLSAASECGGRDEGQRLGYILSKCRDKTVIWREAQGGPGYPSPQSSSSPTAVMRPWTALPREWTHLTAMVDAHSLCLHLYWSDPILGNNKVSRLEALLTGQGSVRYAGVHMHGLSGVYFPVPAGDFLRTVSGSRGQPEDRRFQAAFWQVASESLTCHAVTKEESFEKVLVHWRQVMGGEPDGDINLLVQQRFAFWGRELASRRDEARTTEASTGSLFPPNSRSPATTSSEPPATLTPADLVNWADLTSEVPTPGVALAGASSALLYLHCGQACNGQNCVTAVEALLLDPRWQYQGVGVRMPRASECLVLSRADFLKAARSSHGLPEAQRLSLTLMTYRARPGQEEADAYPRASAARGGEGEEEMMVMDVFAHLQCPISLKLMSDPVLLPDGNTYQREAIQAWVDKCAQDGRPLTSPLTGLPMAAELKNNNLVRCLVMESIRKNEKNT